MSGYKIIQNQGFLKIFSHISPGERPKKIFNSKNPTFGIISREYEKKVKTTAILLLFFKQGPQAF
jgi:hypothetical protein